MRFIIPVILGLATLSSAWCGTVSNKNLYSLHAAYQSYEEATAGQLTQRKEKPRKETPRIVSVYFHIIHSANTVVGGNVTKAVIDRQVGANKLDHLRKPELRYRANI